LRASPKGALSGDGADVGLGQRLGFELPCVRKFIRATALAALHRSGLRLVEVEAQLANADDGAVEPSSLGLRSSAAWRSVSASGSANRLGPFGGEGAKVTRFIYLIPGRTRVLPIDDSFIQRCTQKKLVARFKSLRGADLVYACAAALERATLVTFDQKLKSAFGWDTLP
jgi:hypothetical protein